MAIDDNEIIRRRGLSIIALETMDREKFQQQYQEACDSLYWKNGQCCAGCDYWESHKGLAGQCRANGMVSGDQVMKSIGARFSTYDPGPDFPFCHAGYWCGNFKDDFDWSELDPAYLRKVGAMNGSQIREKPVSNVLSISRGDL